MRTANHESILRSRNRGENTDACGPRLTPIASAVALALLALNGLDIRNAFAELPAGGQVAAGTATIQQVNGQNMVINQSSPKAVINWNSFSVGASDSVVFRQPSVSAVALNRVIGSDPSLIFGTLQANGQVFLLNPSGIVFGHGASVNVGGLVASTLGLTDQDFLAGRYSFVANARAGSVVNQGNIRAADGGYVALLGNTVSNSGSIVANRGSVGLAAGDSALLDFHGDGLMSLRVNVAAAGARIDHSGLIQADGGKVVMTAQAKNALLSTVLNVEGIVNARTLVARNGAIYLDGGSSGVTSISGKLDVSSNEPGVRGGEIRALGEYVGLFDNATLTASGPAGGGTVLVGGDLQGRNVDIPNAKGTYVSRTATIAADATEAGDGGKVIVWSDGTTRFNGRVSARGGERGGDGGFVEISGKNLEYRGGVDTTAARGKTGTLLLDPDAIVIKGGLGDGDNDESNSSFSGSGTGGTVVFGDNGPTFEVFESEIEGASITANIVLQARSSITVDNQPFNNASGNPGDALGVLALAAGRSLTLETRNGQGEAGGINLTQGAHGQNLQIVASGSGSITVQTGTAQDSSAAAANISLPQLRAGTGGVTVSALQGGSININTITTAQPQQAGGPVVVEGGPLALQQNRSVSIRVNAIDTSGNTAQLGAGGSAGSVNLTGTQITLGGPITARGGNATVGVGGNGGSVQLVGPVVLGGDVQIDTLGGAGVGPSGPSSPGSVTFANTIDSDSAARKLTVSGAGIVTFGGNVGGAAPLADLDVSADRIVFNGSGPATLAVNVNAPGGNEVTFTGPITLFNNVAVNTGANSVLFNGTIETDPDVSAALSVTSLATAQFNSDIGAFPPLGSFTASASAIALNGSSIGTTNGQTYNGPVILGSDLFLSSTGGGNITFGRTVESPKTAHSFTTQTTGTTTFNGTVGGNGNPLRSLSTGFGSSDGLTTIINGGAVTTTSDQIYNEAVVINAPTVLNAGTGSITFESTVQAGANPLTLTANTINFNGGAGSVTGTGGLVLQPSTAATSIGVAGGAGTFQVPTDQLQALGNGFGGITIGRADGTGTTLVNTAGFNVPVLIRQPGAGGAITVAGPLTGSNNASITLSAGGAIALNGDITTNNQPISLNGPVTLGGAARTLSAGTGDITFGSTINGASNLVANSTGATRFLGTVGATTPLASLTTNAGGTTDLNGGAITTTGDQNFNDPVTLTANTQLVSTSGNINLLGPINADAAGNRRTLTATAGSGAVALGQVGTTTPLGALTVSARQLTVNGSIFLDGSGALDLSNVVAVLFAPGTVLDTDAAGGSSAAGPVRFGPTGTLNPTGSSGGAVTIDATADGGGNAAGVDLGTAGGGSIPITVLTVSGELINVRGVVTADRIVLTANEVRTPGGQIVATRPFTNFDPANAALTLRGLTTPGTFGQAPPANGLNVNVPGVIIVEPNASGTLPAVWLTGDATTKAPVYEFAATEGRRLVCFNGVCLGENERRIDRLFNIVVSPQEQTALTAVLDQLRKLLDELLMAGFARENVRKQLVQGIVLETGRGRPGIDEFTGEGVTPPINCEAQADALSEGVLACSGQ